MTKTFSTKDQPSIQMLLSVKVQEADFNIEAETEALLQNRRNIGATVHFTGYCRDEEGRLSALELEHYPGMAEAELTRIGEEAIQRFALLGLKIIHRVGILTPGERIVLVLAMARHRQAAFDGAAFVMDFLKSTAPFWKREISADGQKCQWVEAKSHDETAMNRWNLYHE